MRTEKLESMINGWFIGNFQPSLYKTNDVEVAVKKYKAGEKEKKHYHKIATEFTVVIYGCICMNGKRYKENDIIIIEPGESSDFEAVTDTINVVVKIPGAGQDKYLEENALKETRK